MRLCLFSSYIRNPGLPCHVRFYLSQLVPHHDRIVLLTNDDQPLTRDDDDWLRALGITHQPVRNEGFDFGMWQKALGATDISGVTRLSLVNDSCILFAPLDDFFHWHDNCLADMAGMLESQAYGRHLQSFFLVFRGKAVMEAARHILRHPAATLDYDAVVSTFELGLSRELLNKDFTLAARYETHALAARDDPSYFFLHTLLQAGIPLIKRKFLARQAPGGSLRRLVMQGLDPSPEPVVALIRQRHGIDDTLAECLFGDSLRAGHPNRARFRRRVLRFRIERLLRRLFGLPLLP